LIERDGRSDSRFAIPKSGPKVREMCGSYLGVEAVVLRLVGLVELVDT